ncbi:protein Erp6p [[Candida] jaroonii]|uniref:Protein Erp6p n=1 Tax=[Candida] jaroonii TaxID=467808 RepID=A0ACA9YDT5_9ASCO|nr:protein Erp6p [[Candida] jaroonii]
MNWFILWILINIAKVQSLIHYYGEAGERMCFYKELNQGILLIGRFKLEIDIDGEFRTPIDKSNTGLIIDVEEIFDSNHRVVHQKGKSSGQFSFSALGDGEHRICLTPKSFFKKWFDGGSNDPNFIRESKFKHCRVSLDLLVMDSNLLDSKHTGKVKLLNERINQLNNKLIDIKREQKFIREKEEGFRDLSESTNEKVIKWSLIQLVVLLMTCTYHLITIQRFFVKEKIS